MQQDDTVEAQDLVEVTLYYRRPGPKGSDPHGVKKLTFLQPRECEVWWRQARQYRTPHMPNVVVVIDGRSIAPRTASEEGGGSEIDLLDDANIQDLETRRAHLRQECIRLEAQLETLQVSYSQIREHQLNEERSLDASLAAQRELLAEARAEHAREAQKLHARTMAALEAEEEITRSINARIQDADTTLLTTLQERAERTAQVEECTRAAAAALEGTTAERLFNKTCDRLGSAAESPLVMKFADALIRKMGTS